MKTLDLVAALEPTMTNSSALGRARNIISGLAHAIMGQKA